MSLVGSVKRGNKIRWGTVIFIALHFAVPLLNHLVFFYVSNSYSIIMAFQTTVNNKTIWTWDNFKWFFVSLTEEGGIMGEAFLNTAMWWFVSVGLQCVSMFTAFFLYKKIPGHSFFKISFFLPGLLSPIVGAYLIERILSVDGFIAPIVQRIAGLDYTPELLYDSRYAIKTLLGKTIVFGISGGMLVTVGTMSRIPESVIESAKLDGVNLFQEALFIVFPMIMPLIAISVCQVISAFFGANGGEFLYTKGANGTMTFSTWQYLQILGTNPNSNAHNRLSAVGWLITLVSVPLVLLGRKLSSLFGEVEY